MPHFNVNFVDGPFVENLNNYNVFVEFIDSDSGEVVHSDIVKPNYWNKANRRWFTNWNIVIRREGEDGVIYNHKFNCERKKVLIWFDSKSLGDNIGWMPYVEEFRKRHNCEVVCSTFWNKLFEKEYPEIKFIEPGRGAGGLYASYMIGDFDRNRDKNKEEWRTIPLQKTSSDMLGLPYKSIKPKLNVPDSPRTIEGKYVCMAVHSTMQSKYWNYPKGWQIVVNYLNKLGYKIVLISKEKKWYMGNKAPNRVIDKMGDYPIEERMVDLKYADMFLGLGSGLSWLSWGVGTPVVMVSGFSKPSTEFPNSVGRVFNPNVCNSCFNDDNLNFDRGDWNWCPRSKDFECSKEITPDMVIESIDAIIAEKIEVKPPEN